ncbi:MAG: hypothetical protein P4L87_00440 [Formivibrio sp.]|nr:hypothetical protein [Formivibrio sp.]
MSKSKKHAPPVASSHDVGSQQSSASAPDLVSATIYKFSEYTTLPTDASSGHQASIPGLAQSADTDNVVLVSNPDPACPSGVKNSDEQVISDCDNLTAGKCGPQRFHTEP